MSRDTGVVGVKSRSGRGDPGGSEVSAPADLRFYWNPVGRRRWGFGFAVLLLVGVPTAVLIGALIAWLLLAIVAAQVGGRWLFWRSGTGVGETRFGLYLRSWGELHFHYYPSLQGNVAWSQICWFEYIENLFGWERIAVSLIDGSRRDLSGARASCDGRTARPTTSSPH